MLAVDPPAPVLAVTLRRLDNMAEVALVSGIAHGPPFESNEIDGTV